MSMWSSSYSGTGEVATVSPMALSGMSLSQLSLSPMCLSPMSISLMSLDLRHARMAWEVRSEPDIALQKRGALGLESGSCLVSFLRCNRFNLGTDYGTCGGVLFVWVRVARLFVSFVLIY